MASKQEHDRVRKEPRLRVATYRRALLSMVVGAVALASAPVAAQGLQGTVTGRVVDRTGGPIANAQVTVVGTRRGSLTGRDGSFVITEVPSGPREVRAQSLGYRTGTVGAAVPADGSVAVELVLEESAIALDEIVVTGRGTGTARRELGASIAGISAEELDAAPVQSLSQLMQGRAPGVQIMSSGGQAGQGSRILLRGINTLSQRNQPLIYVDGVRIDNSTFGGIRTTGPAVSGLDDINPNDIERIEVIRGASAATLYGSEAAAGVIQIFTKRGTRGAPQWSLSSEYGVSTTPRSWWRESSSVYSDYLYDTMVRTGQLHTQQLSVSGGQEAVQYYVSGTLRGNEGIQPNSVEDYGAFRSNVQITAADDLTLGVNAGYSERTVQLPPQGNNQEGIINNALVGGPAGNWNPPENLVALEMYQNSKRFTGSVTAEHAPGAFSQRLTLGMDVFNGDNTEFLPPEVVPRYSGGYAGNYRRNATNLNLDYGATFRADITPSIRSTTSAGFQTFYSETGINRTYGEDFPFIGLRVVDATASNYAVGESRGEERSAGFFGEQQFGLSDQLFVTFGARADGHSAFGADVDYQIYPKVDVSYVLSEGGFWDDRWGTLRLRGAYGVAGMQPGAFTAVRTWSAIAAAGGEPAVTPGNVGNSSLKPEVSRELELGFDASLLGDRLNVEFTYYDQNTTDALFAARNIPSEGFLGTQLRNIGEIGNKGTEVGTTARLIDTERFSWLARANFSTNSNEVISLGGGAPLTVRWTQEIREGFPIAGFFSDNHLIEHDGEVGRKRDLIYGHLEDSELPVGWDFIGAAQPTRTIQLGSDFEVGENISFGFLFDHKGGHYRMDHTLRWLMDPRRDVTDGQGVTTIGALSTRCREAGAGSLDEAICARNSLLSHGEFVVPADFWKLREVTLAYDVPASLAQRTGAGAIRLTLAGRNLWRWMKTPSLEPEANLDSGSTLQNHSYFDTPVPQQIVAGVTVRF